MNQVKVKKKELLDILKKNRGEHRDIFLKAQERYRETVITELDRTLAMAREKKPVNLSQLTHIVQPRDYTHEYDRVIRMLEMSVDDEITLDSPAFSNFVMDRWSWSGSWANSNSAYVSSPKFNQVTGSQADDVL